MSINYILNNGAVLSYYVNDAAGEAGQTWMLNAARAVMQSLCHREIHIAARVEIRREPRAEILGRQLCQALGAEDKAKARAQLKAGASLKLSQWPGMAWRRGSLRQC